MKIVLVLMTSLLVSSPMALADWFPGQISTSVLEQVDEAGPFAPFTLDSGPLESQKDSHDSLVGTASNGIRIHTDADYIPGSIITLPNEEAFVTAMADSTDTQSPRAVSYFYLGHRIGSGKFQFDNVSSATFFTHETVCGNPLALIVFFCKEVETSTILLKDSKQYKARDLLARLTSSQSARFVVGSEDQYNIFPTLRTDHGNFTNDPFGKNALSLKDVVVSYKVVLFESASEGTAIGNNPMWVIAPDRAGADALAQLGYPQDLKNATLEYFQ